MSGVQNCDRALKQMIQCVVLAVGPFPPTSTSRLLDVIYVMNATRPSLSSTAVCYCEHKQRGLGTRLLRDQAEPSSLAEAIICPEVTLQLQFNGLSQKCTSG